MTYKTLSLEEFESSGYLQEVNRLILNRVGLSLRVVSGKLEIVDARDIEGGIVYNPNYLDQSKTDLVQQEVDARYVDRIKNFGFIVQPLNTPTDTK